MISFTFDETINTDIYLLAINIFNIFIGFFRAASDRYVVATRKLLLRLDLAHQFQAMFQWNAALGLNGVTTSENVFHSLLTDQVIDFLGATEILRMATWQLLPDRFVTRRFRVVFPLLTRSDADVSASQLQLQELEAGRLEWIAPTGHRLEMATFQLFRFIRCAQVALIRRMTRQGAQVTTIHRIATEGYTFPPDVGDTRF